MEKRNPHYIAAFRHALFSIKLSASESVCFMSELNLWSLFRKGRDTHLTTADLVKFIYDCEHCSKYELHAVALMDRHLEDHDILM